MLCRFENRMSGQGLHLEEYSHRIEARGPDQLGAAFAEIAKAQSEGCWIALMLDYELGYWLDPAFTPLAGMGESCSGRAAPLTALVYRDARRQQVLPTAEPDPVGLQVEALISKEVYARNVRAIRASIQWGDLYQTNYTYRLALESTVEPLQLYRSIAGRHPCAHAAYIEDAGRTILSFSPELFVQRSGPTLTVRPMKGTAPRHADPVLDEQSGRELQQSEKNRAENLMIVDLLRNDLGRIAVPGTVKVEELFSLECYPSVWTLTSTITAQAPSASLSDLLTALFPCGSVTGAPKIAAMMAIRELEDTPRGIYCGSVGWLAPDGDLSLNVAIRTIEMRDAHKGVFGVGGGIVFDSDPDMEWEECRWKARILDTGRLASTSRPSTEPTPEPGGT